jgi:hypothetical protein
MPPSQSRADITPLLKSVTCHVLLFVGDNTPLETESAIIMGALPDASVE